MSSLQGRSPGRSFKELLKISNSEAGVDATMRPVTDGSGVSTPLAISTSTVSINNLTWPTTGASTGKVLAVSVDGTTLEWISVNAQVTSQAIITALGYTPESTASKNTANGYAGLDGSGAIGSAQIPATLSNKTLAASTFSGSVTEAIYTIPGTVISGSNGTIQTKILAGNITFTESINDGQSVTLLIQSGAFTVTWPTVSWKTNNGVAPSLNASGFTVIELFKVGGTLFGARVGDA